MTGSAATVDWALSLLRSRRSSPVPVQHFTQPGPLGSRGLTGVTLPGTQEGAQPSVCNVAHVQVLKGFEGAPFRGQGAVNVRFYLAILIVLWAVHAKVER